MLSSLDTFVHQGVPFQVVILFKRMKRIIFRLRDHTIYISAPMRTSQLAINEALTKVMPRLLRLPKPKQYISDDGMYVDGVYQHWSALPSALHIKHNDHNRTIKEVLLAMIQPRVRYFENVMKIPLHYRIRIRTLTSRFASNARHHHTLTFATKLIHFSSHLRDAIIIHELAHHFHMHHQQAFYDVVYRYCPNYDTLRAKIKQGEVQ
jgi:predicted metal-dependent hydrolase